MKAKLLNKSFYQTSINDIKLMLVELWVENDKI